MSEETLEERTVRMSAEVDRQKELLIPKLTDKFLETLVLAARVVGHSVDYSVVEDFVYECFQMADKKSPENLRPIFHPWREES